MKSAYVHIPFCDSFCPYCAFSKTLYNQKLSDAYIESLSKEIKEEIEHQKTLDSSFSLETLYYGGGTPSALNFEQLHKLNSFLRPFLASQYEWTMEINPIKDPESLADFCKREGINRISLGVQTFNENLSRKIGRRHTREDIFKTIEALKKQGITNISIDLIYGLPGQSLEMVKEDLEVFLSLNLPHLSIYSLQIEEGTLFYKNKVQACDEDLEADMYEYIVKTLKQNGYEHYEISSFTKDRHYSKHNLAYWQDEDFLGFGYGASGRKEGMRYDHTKDLLQYINGDIEEKWIEDSKTDASFEAIMMALRTDFGLDINKWNLKYQSDFEKQYQNVLDSYIPEFLVIENNHLKTTEKGMEILNSILLDFM